MSGRHIMRFSADDVGRQKDETDWVRVDSLSETDVEHAIAADPDSEVLPKNWKERLEIVDPVSGELTIVIRLDRETADYLKSEEGALNDRIVKFCANTWPATGKSRS